MDFRDLKKEALQIQAPPEIATVVREKAARERKSISATATELICLGLGIDPTDFGIEPGVSHCEDPEPATATA